MSAVDDSICNLSAINSLPSVNPTHRGDLMSACETGEMLMLRYACSVLAAEKSMTMIARGAAIVAAAVGVLAVNSTAAAADPNPSPAPIYEVHLGDQRYYDSGSFGSSHGSVTVTTAPLPTLSTSIAVGDFQDEATAFMRYYFRVNGPTNLVVPVSLSGAISLTAQSVDTGQANATGQIDLTTPFNSPEADISISRGGFVGGSVTDLFPTLHAMTYTNGWSSITLRATAGARGSRDGGARATAFVDPILSIDSSFFTQGGYDPALFSLSFSDGFGNGPAAATALPEPATWALMILGMGAVGVAARRRQKVATRVSYAV